MGQTSNYGLKQWESWEQVKRGEVNEILGALDTALGEKAEAVSGTYSGTGADNRFIDLGRTPAAVLVADESGRMRDGSYIYGGLAVTSLASSALSITEGGFTVREDESRHCNYNGPTGARQYCYLAVFV